MTDKEINIAIAEARGLQDIDAEGKWGWDFSGIEMPGDMPSMVKIPDYCNDLNAVRGAVETLRKLPGPEWFDFQKHLLDYCGSTMNAIQAPARWKCVAFLKAVGRWKE
jgi:hypothetical protein